MLCLKCNISANCKSHCPLLPCLCATLCSQQSIWMVLMKYLDFGCLHLRAQKKQDQGQETSSGNEKMASRCFCCMFSKWRTWKTLTLVVSSPRALVPQMLIQRG